MNHYYVSWGIDLEAETPEEAAKEALKIQRDPESTASCFEVYDENGEKTQIDLLE